MGRFRARDVRLLPVGVVGEFGNTSCAQNTHLETSLEQDLLRHKFQLQWTMKLI